MTRAPGTGLDRFRLPLLAALLAPAATLGTGVVATIVGRGGVAGLPIGLHTYVPLAVLVDPRWIGLGSVAAAVAALGLLVAWHPRTGEAAHFSVRSVGRAAAVVVAIQFLLYCAQALALAQLQGLPDAPQAVVAAVVLQSLLTLLAVLSFGSVAALVPPPPSPRITAWATAGTPHAAPPLPATPQPVDLSSVSRRGPPVLLHLT